MTSDEHGPHRTCLGCRKSLEREELLRFVVAPDNRLTVDYRGRLPGRGAYTCLERRCLEEAVRKKQFGRAFRREVDCPSVDELVAELLEQIRERILGLVGMARKSNQLISGSNLVLDRLNSGKPPALVVISDDISDGVGEKVVQRAEHHAVSCFRMFDKELLGHILGSAQRSVMAILPGSLAEAIRRELERYQRIAGEY